MVQPEKKDVGASVPVIAIIAILTAVALIAAGVYLYRTLSEEVTHRPIVIATGPDSGAYHALGMALKRVLENTGEFSEVVILTTDGSAENMGLVGSQGRLAGGRRSLVGKLPGREMRHGLLGVFRGEGIRPPSSSR